MDGLNRRSCRSLGREVRYNAAAKINKAVNLMKNFAGLLNGVGS